MFHKKHLNKCMASLSQKHLNKCQLLNGIIPKADGTAYIIKRE